MWAFSGFHFTAEQSWSFRISLQTPAHEKKIIFAEKHEPFEKFIFEIVKKYVHLVDLVKSLPTSIKYLVAKFGFDTPEQFNNQ